MFSIILHWNDAGLFPLTKISDTLCDHQLYIPMNIPTWNNNDAARYALSYIWCFGTACGARCPAFSCWLWCYLVNSSVKSFHLDCMKLTLVNNVTSIIWNLRVSFSLWNGFIKLRVENLKWWCVFVGILVHVSDQGFIHVSSDNVVNVTFHKNIILQKSVIYIYIYIYIYFFYCSWNAGIGQYWHRTIHLINRLIRDVKGELALLATTHHARGKYYCVLYTASRYWHWRIIE